MKRGSTGSVDALRPSSGGWGLAVRRPNALRERGQNKPKSRDPGKCYICDMTQKVEQGAGTSTEGFGRTSNQLKGRTPGGRVQNKMAREWGGSPISLHYAIHRVHQTRRRQPGWQRGRGKTRMPRPWGRWATTSTPIRIFT